MKKILGITLLFLLGLGAIPGLRAEEPKDIIEQAIKAAGGEEKLAKFKAAKWSAKGTYHGTGNGVQYTASYAVQWPDKFRADIKEYALIVLNGDKGWMKLAGGETIDMDEAHLAEQKETHHAGYVTTLLPLKDKAYTLTPLGEVKVGDRPAVGVKVSSKGHRDVNLYFDKESHLLVKGEWTVKAQEEMFKEVTQETLWSDYQDIEGAKIPMKMTINRDGKKYVEAEDSELKPMEKPDESLFAKP